VHLEAERAVLHHQACRWRHRQLRGPEAAQDQHLSIMTGGHHPEHVEGRSPVCSPIPFIERISVMKDGISGLGLVASLVPAVVTATTKGSHADLQGYNAATLIITTGAIAGDGVFDVKLQHADTTDDGDFSDVAAADL